MRNKVLALVVGSYLVDVIYTMVEWDFQKTYSFFPFFHGHSGWDGRMALGSYVYFYCQHVCVMMLLWAAYLASGMRFLKYVFWVEFADLIDYALCYHEKWLTINGFDFEFSYAKILIVFALAAREWKSTT